MIWVQYLLLNNNSSPIFGLRATDLNPFFFRILCRYPSALTMDSFPVYFIYFVARSRGIADIASFFHCKCLVVFLLFLSHFHDLLYDLFIFKLQFAWFTWRYFFLLLWRTWGTRRTRWTLWTGLVQSLSSILNLR